MLLLLGEESGGAAKLVAKRVMFWSEVTLAITVDVSIISPL
jgi:hypothetical protein